MSNNNAEMGTPVDLFAGRFVGSFELPVEFAEGLKIDDVGTALVTYIVSDPTYKRNKKSGEMTRTLKFEVMGWSEIDSSAAAAFVGSTNPVVVQVP